MTFSLTLLILATQLVTTLGRPSLSQDEGLAAIAVDDSVGTGSISVSGHLDAVHEDEDSDPDVEWLSVPFNESASFNDSLAVAIEKRVADLGGTKTPKGGTYPAGYTGYGRSVTECANDFWDNWSYGKCRRQKIEDGACYRRYWTGGSGTLVPDKELSCDYWQSDKCVNDKVIYKSDWAFEEFQVREERLKKKLWGKVARRMYGVKWPCCETFRDQNGEDWRMAREADAPMSYMCWTMSKQKGL